MDEIKAKVEWALRFVDQEKDSLDTSAASVALVALHEEVLRLRTENSRLNDMLSQVSSSDEDA
jgi:hypothetical protein